MTVTALRLGIATFLVSSLVVSGGTNLAGTSDSVGNVLHVPRDYSTIQSAVAAAVEGDTIQVSRGVYNENVVITTSGLKLHGSGDTVLDGSGLSGIGFHVRGSASAPVSGVEISNFVVHNFERGVIVQFAIHARIHHNEIRENVDKTPPLVLGDATGIELVTSHFSQVTQNIVHDNGDGGIQLRVGSSQNTIQGNRVYANGTQRMADFEGRGIMATGAGTHDNRIEHNEVTDNFGRGITINRPLGTAPITGNVVAHNRAHGNQRSGISIMAAATSNIVMHNDARNNNLSGLPPCYECNLVDLSIGGNVWERNLGTFNLTDMCAP